MIIRSLSSLMGILLFAGSLNEALSSESEDNSSPTKFPNCNFLNQTQALNYWKTHCQDSCVDLSMVQEEFSPFTWDYNDLLNNGFDPFFVDDYRGHVFSNITVNLSEFEKKSFGLLSDTNLVKKICNTLKQEDSWVTRLKIKKDYKTFNGNIRNYDQTLCVKPALYWDSFAKALAKNTSLVGLDLSENYFTKEQWSEISNALQNKTELKEIDFSECCVFFRTSATGPYLKMGGSGNQIASDIIPIIKSTSLKKVTLNNIGIKNNAMLMLVESLPKSSVTHLSLQGNEISPVVGNNLIDLLNKGKHFDTLDLTKCKWIDFGPFNFESYDMVKRIGHAAQHKITQLSLDSYTFSKVEVDYATYNPRHAFISDTLTVAGGLTLSGLGCVIVYGLFKLPPGAI